MSDELIDLQVAIEVVLDKAWKLAAALDTAKGTTLPHTAGNELECYFEIQVSMVCSLA